jgi:RNA polymerase sigma factor
MWWGNIIVTNYTRNIGMQVLEKRLESIKNGNMEEKEFLIRDYMPFIVKSVSKCMDSYLESMESDEFSIGIKAFDEALQRYEMDKGNFISYADLVISSRIKDYMKKENRHRNLPLSSFETENGNMLEGVLASEDFTIGMDIKEQLEAFKIQLKYFDITIEQLVEESPKHKDTRLRALEVARHISQNAILKNEFLRKNKLPYKQLRKEMKISQKIIRRSNRFIIAAVLIFINDWPDLKNQLPEVDEKRGDAD